jgi:hypothetical protein
MGQRMCGNIGSAQRITGCARELCDPKMKMIVGVLIIKLPPIVVVEQDQQSSVIQ